MANKRMEFLIGMTVLTVFVTIIVMTILFGSNHNNLFQFNHGQKMTILFDKAQGIKNTSRVSKSGIEIGRVYRSELVDGEKGAQVRVHFTLNDPKTKIFSNERARINTSLMGEAEIEFIKNKDYQGEIHELTGQDVIVGISGGNIMGTVSNIEGDLKDAIQSINLTAQEASRFIGNLNEFMGSDAEIKMKKERLTAIFTELGETLKTTRGLAANMDDIISDPQIKENIHKSAKEIPNILNKVDSILTNADTLSASLKQTIDRSYGTFDKIDRNLDNLDDFTGSLSDQGPEFISNLNDSSRDIHAMVKNISNLTQNLVTQMENKETPLGMLTDEEVGRSLRGTVRNVETATEKIHPILDDTRVFTNKVAHRPSSLIFSKTTYKGESSLSGNRYHYQSHSPGGGLNSPLFTPSNDYYRSTVDPEYSDAFDTASAPNTLEAYYAAHPNTARAVREAESGCLGGNCLTDKFGKMKFSLCKHRDDEGVIEGYTEDPAEYYGYSAATPEGEGNGSVVTQADLAPDEYLIDADGRQCSKGCLGKTDSVSGSCASKVKFSLASAFHKILPCRAKEDAVLDESPAPMAMDVVYQPGDWVTDGGCGVTEPSCEPSCEPVCGDSITAGGSGYGTNALTSPMPTFDPNSPLSLPSASPASPTESSASGNEGGNQEVLPESAVKRNPDAAYRPSPMSPEYSSDGGRGANLSEIPLGPLPHSASGFQPVQPPKPQKSAPAGNGLPSPVKPSSKKGGTNKTASAAPVVPTRSFVDDGLPIQFTPNL